MPPENWQVMGEFPRRDDMCDIPAMSTGRLLALIEDAGRQIEEAANVAPDVYQLYGRGVRLMAQELRRRGVSERTLDSSRCEQ